MHRDEAIRLLTSGMEAMGIGPLADPCLSQLWLYFAELGKWNRKMNLVAKAPDLEILENHFLDSLTLLAAIPSGATGPLLDVGSGAGFPGLVLKIARPELRVCLVEPRQKRVSFLRQVIRSLRLTGIEVSESRLEADDAGFIARHGRFPLITSRALTEIGPFLALVRAIAPPSGKILCMKGPKAEAELAAWRRESPASPFVLDTRLELTLPSSGAERTLVIFGKGEPEDPGREEPGAGRELNR